MDVEEAIRSRRTHKAYASEPLDRATLDELLELARWAPNHHLTNPWRFRVVGPEALAGLKEAAGPEAAAKLDRAPTLVVGVGAPDRTTTGPGRGGPVRRGVRRSTSSCWRAHARGLGRLLAHARRAAHARGARGRGRAGRRALRSA